MADPTPLTREQMEESARRLSEKMGGNMAMQRGEGGFTGIAPPTQEPPEMQGNMPDLSGMAQSLTQRPPEGPPSQSGRLPNTFNFLKDLLNAGKGHVVDGVPQRPGTKSEAFQSFLGNFLTSFSQGMGAAGTGPGANGRGFAAAMAAPYQRDLQQYGLQQQAQQQQFNQDQQGQLNQSLIQERGTQSDLNLAQAQRVLIPAQDTSVTEFDLWRQQNPNKPISDWFRLKADSSTTQPSELQQWLKENTGKSTTDYLRFKSSLNDNSATGGAEEKAYQQALMGNPKLSRTDFHKKWGELGREELTASTRTMIEAAPKVQTFASKIQKQLDELNAGLGPAASRWREFQAGKIGISDPAFTKLRTDVGLLTTLLMRMHVGARGGEYIMKHFTELIDSSKQSPENLKAAIEEISSYASDVIEEGKTGGRMGLGGGASTPPRPPGVPPEAVWNQEARQWQMPK